MNSLDPENYGYVEYDGSLEGAEALVGDWLQAAPLPEGWWVVRQVQSGLAQYFMVYPKQQEGAYRGQRRLSTCGIKINFEVNVLTGDRVVRLKALSPFIKVGKWRSETRLRKCALREGCYPARKGSKAEVAFQKCLLAQAEWLMSKLAELEAGKQEERVSKEKVDEPPSTPTPVTNEEQEVVLHEMDTANPLIVSARYRILAKDVEDILNDLLGLRERLRRAIVPVTNPSSSPSPSSRRGAEEEVRKCPGCSSMTSSRWTGGHCESCWRRISEDNP